MVHFNAQFKYILALDFHYLRPLLALGDLSGSILDECSMDVPPKANAADRAALVIRTAHLLLEQNQLATDMLCCIAVSAPGIFDGDNHLRFANEQFSEWFEVDIFSQLSAQFGTPVLVKNDVKTALIGELQFGAGIHSKSLLYVSCGLGIGSAIALDGRLYEGDRFSAGEIYNYIDSSKLAAGTNLEKTVCLDALLQTLHKKIQSGSLSSLQDFPNFSFQDIITAYRGGDALVLDAIREIGSEIGCAVSNIANLLAIDLVVIGGEYLVFADTLLPVIQQIASHTAQFPSRSALLCENAMLVSLVLLLWPDPPILTGCAVAACPSDFKQYKPRVPAAACL